MHLPLGPEAWEAAGRREYPVSLLIAPHGANDAEPAMLAAQIGQALQQLKRAQPSGEVLLLGQAGQIDVVAALQSGAYDVRCLATSSDELTVLILKAYERQQLLKESRRLRQALKRVEPPCEIVGQSAAIREVLRRIEVAGSGTAPVLIQGAAGTGKELAARALHRASQRAHRPLLAVRCQDHTSEQLERALFGGEASDLAESAEADLTVPVDETTIEFELSPNAERLGLLELADGGTLLIDEIGDMPPAVQARLLHVLQEGIVRRADSQRDVRVDVRIVATTRRDLRADVEAGRFGEDLWNRVGAVTIKLPLLSEREGDVRRIVFQRLGPQGRVADDVLAALEQYTWPGNVRQLHGVVDAAAIPGEESILRLADLPGEIAGTAISPAAPPTKIAWPLSSGLTSSRCWSAPRAIKPARRACWASPGGASTG